MSAALLCCAADGEFLPLNSRFFFKNCLITCDLRIILGAFFYKNP
jgi:hypothetical protein